MHEINLEILRNEARRLVEMEVALLQEMLEEPGVITVAQTGEIQTFDQESAAKHIEVLKGEKTKLDELEMVLAVVGTMKAGKSTSINAIVGTEVLPNRNRPMTALPTLIRHIPGQTEPLLRFENDKPIHNLTEVLKGAIRKPHNEEILTNLKNDPDMVELLDIIDGHGGYKPIYHGADEIFEFLKRLNDIVRLSKELKVDFPFSDYDEIHELPVIEVEFAHLRETNQANGRLTLLDTPGPNESGQPHLRKMLREQLSKASAVLAILDFTQLKSDADAEVRKELQDIAEVSKGRLFALVNKFDQKDRHSDTTEEIKIFVAEHLMSGRIRPDDVFPVSSRWGYLANRAMHELFLNGKLPDPNVQPWVADFGDEAFGRRWETKISDAEEVRASAEALWQDSLYHAPLEGVIKTAHARAAGFAIDSAAAKLVDIAERIDNLLTTRETALTKSVKVLQTQISALQNDIERVGNCEATSRKYADQLHETLVNGSKQVFDKTRDSAFKSLEAYFQEGKRVEGEKHEQKIKEQRMEKNKRREDRGGRGIQDIFNSFLNLPSIQPMLSGANDFDPQNPVMKFSDSSDARDLIDKIEHSLAQILSKTEITMKKAMDAAIKEFDREFSSSVLTEARKLIEEMKGRLKDEGFEINLNPPSAAQLSLNFSGSDMLNDVLEQKSKDVNRWRRQTGMWGSICRFFETDEWGWESYNTTETYYEVDIEKIRAATNHHIEATFDGLDQAIATYIKKPLDDRINAFFSGFKRTVEQLRGDLLQSIRDQERSKDEQVALTKRLKKLRKSMPIILSDTRALKQDVVPLVTVEV